MSEDMKIFEILAKWNAWDKELGNTGFPRSITNRAIDHIKGPEAIAFKGVRRSGKSTIMLQIIKELLSKGVKSTDIMYINFEEPFFIENKGKNILEKIYGIYREQINPDRFPYIFLDEIQEISNWEKWVRAKIDLKEAKILITGSSSKLLSAELSTLLTGRNISFTVQPLSFKEFLEFKGIKISKDKVWLMNNKTIIKNLLKEYMKFGGFPEAVLRKNSSAKEILLKQYFEDILYKDIVARHQIRDVETLKNIAYFYLTNMANLISYNKIKNILDVPMDVVRSYSSYLYESFLVKDVLKHSFKVKEQLRNPKKTYTIDTGLRNTVSYRFSEDFGRVAENIVFNALAGMGREIYYYKNLGEVDFVVKRGARIEELIQVSMINAEDEKAAQREIRALEDGMKNLNVAKGKIITSDWEESVRISKGVISAVPLWMWLLRME